MYQGRTIAAIITAAGSGTRMNKDKMLMPIAGKSVIVHTAEVFENCGFFDEIIVLASESNIEKISALLPGVTVTLGGATRGESVVCGLKESKCEFVLIHDGARPLITYDIIEKTLVECIKNGSAAVGVTPKDTVKMGENGIISGTVPRGNCILIQTPQGFLREELITAYEKQGTGETDDCGVMEKMGARIKIVEGSYENLKLTTPEDVITAEKILKRRKGIEEVCSLRIGTGFDTHRLTEGRDLIIGGVNIPCEKGLLGHSDADVLIHAVIDSLLGAAALGDIGTHFPDTDEKYKGISSMKLLAYTAELLKKAGYKIGNIDTTLIAQAPKMAPYIKEMEKNLASALGIDVSQISVKAKSNEKMGFTGRGEGIEARAVSLIVREC